MLKHHGQKMFGPLPIPKRAVLLAPLKQSAGGGIPVTPK